MGGCGSRATPSTISEQTPASKADSVPLLDRLIKLKSGSQKASVIKGPNRPLALKDLWVFGETQGLRELYTLGKILGQGQFGTTRLVVEKATGAKYACKSISKRRLGSTSDVEDIRREVQIMHHLSGHPNVVKIKAVYEDRVYVHLVMELCSGGELFDRIVERGHYTEQDAAAVLRTVVEVVAHCHSMGVLHRDIKPENFLLTSKSPNAKIKATDFGLSIFFDEDQRVRDIVGSALYVAPEVLRKAYNKEADMWSCGVLLWILLSGEPPFFDETERGTFQKVLKAELDFSKRPWPSISEEAKDCVRRMLARDPQARATAEEVLGHPWVRPDGAARAQPIHSEVLTRLQAFAAMNKLQQEALKVIAANLPENEIMGLKVLFQQMDVDGSGSVSTEELREALRRKGTRIPEQELERIMRQADINGDGTIDYEEFLAATMNLAKLEHEEHLFMAFTFFDTDGSGYITKEKLLEALAKVVSDQTEVDALMAQVDTNGDGMIDYEEFCDMMRSGNEGLRDAARHMKQGMLRSVRSMAALDLALLTHSPSDDHDPEQEASAADVTATITSPVTAITTITTITSFGASSQIEQQYADSAPPAAAAAAAPREGSVSWRPSSAISVKG